MPLKICAITSSRADWGLLSPVLEELRRDPAFALQIVATGQHCGPNGTLKHIAAEGFAVAAAVDMGLSEGQGGDTPAAVTASLATGLRGLGEALASLRPDLLLVLGDRYEILGAVLAAALAGIPVAHIAGGDITEGANDDAFRHATTKMSHLHFTTTEIARQRVLQLGESPDRVFATGSPGLDRIRTNPRLDRAAFFELVGLPQFEKLLMITFHPETLAVDTVADCREMLAALDQVGRDVAMIFSGANADVDGRKIENLVQAFIGTHDNAALCLSLGSAAYLSGMALSDAVVGNSSSGLYEAPSFGTPTVNIGDRQKGRERATSVIDVPAERHAIHAAILQAMAMDCTGVRNPYGDGHAAARIVAALKDAGADPRRLLKKRFETLPHRSA